MLSVCREEQHSLNSPLIHHKKTDARLSFCYACHSGLAEADSLVFYKQLNLWLRVNAHPSENTADDASLFY